MRDKILRLNLYFGLGVLILCTGLIFEILNMRLFNWSCRSLPANTNIFPPPFFVIFERKLQKKIMKILIGVIRGILCIGGFYLIDRSTLIRQEENI